MLIRKLVLPVLVGFATIAANFPAPSYANILEELSALTRKATFELGVQVNLAGKQRMLIQEMSKETLLVALDVDVEENRGLLKKSIALFDRTLLGLRKGDQSLDLVETTNQKILAQLQKVEKLWKDFKPLVESLANGQNDNKTLELIATGNMPLLAVMNKAVGMYASMSGADAAELATVINMSGKQRMLTQKMTKEFLMIARGIKVKENRQALEKTIKLFDKTLKGLLDGDKGLGLPATTDPKIRDQLAVVKKLWVSFYPLLQKPATPSSLRQVEKANLPLLAEMDKAVKMYEQSR